MPITTRVGAGSGGDSVSGTGRGAERVMPLAGVISMLQINWPIRRTTMNTGHGSMP